MLSAGCVPPNILLRSGPQYAMLMPGVGPGIEIEHPALCSRAELLDVGVIGALLLEEIFRADSRRTELRCGIATG